MEAAASIRDRSIPAFSRGELTPLCRIYALGARPGTVRREMVTNLPECTRHVKRHPVFHDYRDELMSLMRQHGQEAVAAIAA